MEGNRFSQEEMRNLRTSRNTETPAQAAPHTRKNPLKSILLGPLAILIIILIAASAFLYIKNRSVSPVPRSIANSVSIPVYYPDPKKLPADFRLDKASIKNPVKDGVTYKIIYGSGQKLTFSIQPKPSDSDLQFFKANYIPLNNPIQTNLGTAYFGAYNNHGTTESLISLPTTGKDWIIVTGPYDINQDQVKQVLNSLTL